MEGLNDNKLNRMINSAYEIHHGRLKGIDMNHLIPHTLHTLEDGRGLQMILSPRNKASKDGVIKLTELLRDLGKKGIESHGISPQLLTNLHSGVNKIYGNGKTQTSGKGSGKTKKTHRGGNITISNIRGGDIPTSLKSALIPSLIGLSPAIVKSLGSFIYNRDTKKAKEDMKQIGKAGLVSVASLGLKNELNSQLSGLLQ